MSRPRSGREAAAIDKRGRGALPRALGPGTIGPLRSLLLVVLVVLAATGCSARATGVTALPPLESTDAGDEIAPGTGNPPSATPGPTGSQDEQAGAVTADGVPGAARPFVYVVRPGETLWRIARRYGVDHRELARANGIEDPSRLAAGRELVIAAPGREPDADGNGVPPVPRSIRAATAGFAWPVRGRVSSGFGSRRGSRRHQGIDILVPSGTPIVASHDGVVRFAGRRGDYGNLVIVDHEDGFSSYYAHNRSVRVDRGDDVKRGQEIAASGRTGNASAPHLHFEIRRHGMPLDPLVHLEL